MDTTNWTWFRYDEIFDIKKGKRLTSFDQEAGDIPYIGAIDSNNGVSAYIANDKHLHAGNTISVSYNGSIGQAYYQDQPFWATDDVNVFYPKYHFNKYIAFFILPLIEKEKYRFCYGRKWTSESMRSSRMPLPTKNDDTPDWQYMEEYVKNTLIPQLPEQARAVWNLTYDVQPKGKKKDLKMEKWKEFRIGDYFDSPYKATAYNAINMQEVSNNDRFAIAYVTRTDENNGIKCFLKKEDDMRYERGNAITLGDTTSTVFYQEQDFVCGDHMVVFRSKYLNKYTGMFIVTLLNRERYRYSYGRAYLKEALADTILRLPAVANPDGTYSPDWQFMEDYIKSLPYSKNI